MILIIAAKLNNYDSQSLTGATENFILDATGVQDPSDRL